MAKQVITPTTPWVVNSTSPYADQSYQAGDRPAVDDAVKVYELAFSGDTPLHQTPETAYDDNGYINFLGSGGTGHGSTNIDTVDITDDSLFPGTIKGLQDTYFGGGTNYTFANQTLFIFHNEMQKFYMRMRCKWSADWEWGNDQLKFCKNKGDDGGAGTAEVSTNCPKFNGSGTAYITKLAPVNPSSNEQSVVAVATDTIGDYYIEDGINNEFGGAGVDANWSPTLDQWYWLEWEIDAGTAGSADGSYKVWIDGDLYMQLDNTQIAEVGDALFTRHQLGHVWQNGSPTTDIDMIWHDVEIFDKRPATLPGVF